MAAVSVPALQKNAPPAKRNALTTASATEPAWNANKPAARVRAKACAKAKEKACAKAKEQAKAKEKAKVAVPAKAAPAAVLKTAAVHAAEMATAAAQCNRSPQSP